MSSELLWCDAVNGPQNAAHASPFAMYELAKNTLPAAVNPLLSLHASPTKQSCIFTLFIIDEPSPMIEFSQMTPVPIYTDALLLLIKVQSLRRAAPAISQSSYITVFVISFVFTIFTRLPMAAMSGAVRSISSRIKRRMVSLSGRLWKCFTMSAAT